MKRFMGIMPSSEVKMERRFKVGIRQLPVTIQSGENGWTILYADSSSEYEYISESPENNFNAALDILKLQFMDVNEFK